MLYQGDTLHGFEVNRVRHSEELNGSLYEMTHLSTGAQLCWLDNGLSNKLFAICFTSLPCDDSGVFHILEHSVLCGSRKYPVKEPFAEMRKRSLHTFLNAMTASDQTVYPIASRNEQDYINLMNVYLDAVFAPRLLDEKNIFLQEGWHIEEKDGTLSCKGVVYNEMKGALSDESGLLSRRFARLLFPDTSYGYNAGGSPDAIRRLSYEQFLDTYKKVYHPSNARVYLDGSVPIERTLERLNAYFSLYERRTDLPQFRMQTPTRAEAVQYFELKAGESSENKSSLCFGKIIGTWKERLKVQAVSVLADVLAGNNEAPLRKALLDAALAVNLSITVRNDGLQPYVMIYLKQLKDGQEAAALNCLRDKVRELIECGLDKKSLHAIINRLEFSCQETAEPQGLYRMFALSHWQMGGDPLELLCNRSLLAELRSMVDSGAYEALMQEIFLDDENMVTLRMIPSATFGEELRQAEETELHTLWNRWTEEERIGLSVQNQALLQWQQTPDSPKQLSTLPLLPLSAVSNTPDWVNTTQSDKEGVKVLFHALPCGGIIYTNLYFDLTDFDISDLSALSILTLLFGKLPTRTHSAQEIDRLLKEHTGKTSFTVLPFALKNQPNACRVCLSVRFSALKEHFEAASALIVEIIRDTLFTDVGKIQIIARQMELAFQQICVRSGQSLGIFHTLSRYSASGAVCEAIGGLTAYRWIRNLLADFDAHVDELTALIERLRDRTLCKKNLTLSITATEIPEVSTLISAFPEGETSACVREYTLASPSHVALPVPARVSYAVQGYHLSQSGAVYHGSMKVGAKILSLEYLWNKVRVQGGAYSARFAISPNGEMHSYSYRDPSPHASIVVNRYAAQYIRDLCTSGEPIDRYILAAASEDDPLLSACQAGENADSLYFSNYTLEDAQRNRQEILSTTTNDLLRFCQLMDDFAQHGSICVIGHPNALNRCDSLETLSV